MDQRPRSTEKRGGRYPTLSEPEWFCFLLDNGKTTPWCMSRVWIDHPTERTRCLPHRIVAVIRCRPKQARRAPRFVSVPLSVLLDGLPGLDSEIVA